MRILLFMAGVLLLVAGCTSQPALPPASFNEPLPPVAAQYQTVRHCDGEVSGHSAPDSAASSERVDWRFFRSAQRLTIDNLSAQNGEDWQRDGNALFMRKLFHAEGKAIEYRSDDLSGLNINPQWRYKSLLIDPDELARLGQPENYWQDGIPMYRYRGEIEGKAVRVEWRADLAIPVRIEREGSVCVQVTQLQQVSALDQAPWPVPSIDDYLVIDYSDIGDMERDPFIHQVYSQLPGGEVHHH